MHHRTIWLQKQSLTPFHSSLKKKKQKTELLPELLEVKQAHTQRGKMYQKLEHQLDKNITFSTFKTSSTLQQGIKEMPIPYNKMLQIPEEIHFGYCG